MSVYFFDLLEDTLGFFHLSLPSASIVKRFLTILSFKGAFTSNVKFAFTKGVFKTLFRNTIYFPVYSWRQPVCPTLFIVLNRKSSPDVLCPRCAPSPFPLLISHPGISLPSFTCSFILQISNLSSLPLSDPYGAQMPHLPAPLVRMATTNPTFTHLTIYFPVSHFPLPHDGPKIPMKIKILSSLVAV